MKKNLVYGLLLLSTLSVSLNSCRTDEMLTSTEQTQKEKIAFFERFEKEKSLSKNAESNNYALPFGNSMLAYFNNYPEKKTELENRYGTVDLSVSSQDIGGDDGDNRKLLFFPMLKDGKVTAVIAGVINAERDYLYFDVHQNTNSDVIYLINKFQHYYDTKTVSRNSNNPIDVGEVIIRVTRPVKLTMYDVWSGGGGIGSGGHDMGGGPGDYGGGGSGSTPNTPNTTNPCEQTKNIVNNSKSKPAIDSLKQQSKLSDEKEKGFKVNSDGTTTQINSGKHEVDLGDAAGYLGGYHNHTPSGIKMFSPPDIVKMLSFAMAQTNGNIGNGFMGMIGSEPCSSCPDGYRYYHYMINFNGTSQELAGFLYNANWDLESLKDDYRDKEKELSENLSYTNQLGGNLNSNGLQKLFFDTLKNMKMEGKVSLQKIEDNGTVQSVTLNSNGSSTTATPCP
ncbi:hypothetical protein [Chryseobacterium oncorhynchi]|uniref:Uncharacterized protein n=1 Tax=Chryseobacterium oncorhynchi TaxID=741074 RepID=A0A316X8M6_9FLAO|nr:hypothetical protein [Chryseobacterium oncorhynchi]PWN67678.1 hypothetical protein C1638_003545 [Chryseobacterium oncorhynchi]